MKKKVVTKKSSKMVRFRNVIWWQGFKSFKPKKDINNPYKSTSIEGCDFSSGWETANKDYYGSKYLTTTE